MELTPFQKNALTVAAIAAIVYFIWKKNKDAFDPTSDKNLAYQAANKLTQFFTGDPNADLGTSVYNATHPGDATLSSLINVNFPDGTPHVIDMALVTSHIIGAPSFIAPTNAGPWAGKKLYLRDMGGEYFATES